MLRPDCEHVQYVSASTVLRIIVLALMIVNKTTSCTCPKHTAHALSQAGYVPEHGFCHNMVKCVSTNHINWDKIRNKTTQYPVMKDKRRTLKGNSYTFK